MWQRWLWRWRGSSRVCGGGSFCPVGFAGFSFRKGVQVARLGAPPTLDCRYCLNDLPVDDSSVYRFDEILRSLWEFAFPPIFLILLIPEPVPPQITPMKSFGLVHFCPYFYSVPLARIIPWEKRKAKNGILWRSWCTVHGTMVFRFFFFVKLNSPLTKAIPAATWKLQHPPQVFGYCYLQAWIYIQCTAGYTLPDITECQEYTKH